MSNLKVERARKLELGGGGESSSSGRERDQQGRHRGRAASCTEGLYHYRRQVANSGNTQNSSSAYKFHHFNNNNMVNNCSSSFNNSNATTSLVSNNNKRKYSCDAKTLGGLLGPTFKRRKKESTMIPPTKFLLGGNINDPLNLNSFIDEKLGTPIKQLTPQTSPMPTPKFRQQVAVLIPPNINDPLNLDGGEEDGDLELNLISPKTKKRKRTHKRKKSASISETPSDPSLLTSAVPHSSDAEKSAEFSTNNASDQKTHLQVNVPPQTLSILPSHKTKRSLSGDKIVSPVIPQPTGMGRKRYNSGHSRSQAQGFTTEVAGASTSTDNTSRHHHSRKRNRHKQAASSVPASKKKNSERFVYGNYNRYYGYRNPDNVDVRVECFKREWFEGKDVLDIGCNIGHVTFCVARDFNPRKVIGLDIDEFLIKVARKNVVHYLRCSEEEKVNNLDNQFPISLSICYGPVAAPLLKQEDKSAFPHNLCFVQGNYVPKSDERIEAQSQEFDLILCLSLTKWVHLNWGDDGLKRMFRRMYKQLRPGGKLVLEAQSWTSYSKRKKLSEKIFKNYQEIKLKPENFNTYLLSKEVGFSTCEVVGVPLNTSKGFRRPIQLFTKSGEVTT